jgi:hypothetical protein
MAHKLSDYGRREINLIERKIKEILPEYFRAEYPDLITFLESYYDFVNQDATNDNFDLDIKQLYRVRDIPETELANLNRIIKELSAGLENGDTFVNPRFSARRFADFYRSKGSENSIKEFFRAFFQQEVEVEYPKKQMFIVGESEIGFDSLKFIQDYELYQVYSILIKVGIGTQTWDSLYKKYVHPAGWFFNGRIVNEGVASFGIGNMPLSIEDSSIGPVIVSEAIAQPFAPFTQETATVAAPEGGQVLVGIDRDYISRYQSVSIEDLEDNSRTITEIITPNSPTFADSGTPGEADFASALFSMDQSTFGRTDTIEYTYRFSSTENTFDTTSETFDDVGTGT